MAQYDFKKHLSLIDPFNQYEIVPLTGGRVNFVVRAVKANPERIDTGKFAGHRSLVLKYAPPYIALSGEGAPFSQFRQIIESRALALFAPRNGTVLGGELLELCHRWKIKIPQLISHDLQAKILIMEDLGELDTLTERLRQLLTSGSGDDREIYSQLGCRVGSFMADLHSDSTLRSVFEKGIKHFDQPKLKYVIYQNMITQILSRLEDFRLADAAELYRRVEDDHLRADDTWELSFVLGDLWTGSILLRWPEVCIIDWEFAGLGRGPHEDMATFLAQLHLHLLATEPASMSHLSIITLIRSTVDGYRGQNQAIAEEENKKSNGGIRNIMNCAKFAGRNASQLPVELLSVIRTAFIVHGRKMINNAVERDWGCVCCKADQKSKEDCGNCKPISIVTTKLKCKLFAKMMKRGIWYLRTAAYDVKAFSLDNNWAEVRNEVGRIILGLFFDEEPENSD